MTYFEIWLYTHAVDHFLLLELPWSYLEILPYTHGICSEQLTFKAELAVAGSFVPFRDHLVCLGALFSDNYPKLSFMAKIGMSYAISLV